MLLMNQAESWSISRVTYMRTHVKTARSASWTTRLRPLWERVSSENRALDKNQTSPCSITKKMISLEASRSSRRSITWSRILFKKMSSLSCWVVSNHREIHRWVVVMKVESNFRFKGWKRKQLSLMCHHITNLYSPEESSSNKIKTILSSLQKKKDK